MNPSHSAEHPPAPTRLVDYALRYRGRYAVGLSGLLLASFVVMLPPW
jgi:hypothetical protein